MAGVNPIKTNVKVSIMIVVTHTKKTRPALYTVAAVISDETRRALDAHCAQHGVTRSHALRDFAEVCLRVAKAKEVRRPRVAHLNTKGSKP
jgi:hypothetical protein